VSPVPTPTCWRGCRNRILSPRGRLELGDVAAETAGEGSLEKGRSLEEIERRHILSVLDETRWRVSGERGAARILGIKRTTLESRMKKLGIARPS